MSQSSAKPRLPRGFCPYVGLQPYTEEDREFFFGRSRDAKLIAANFYASTLTVLYGASGVGKSSVLLAGVVPELENDPRALVIPFRDWQDAAFEGELKRRVLDSRRRLWDRPAFVDPALPFDELLARCSAEDQASFFFLFDQFEEYFLYHRPNHGPDGFEAEFARAVNRDDTGASFLVAIREDGLSKLDRFQRRIPNLLSNRYQLDHLDQAEAEEAIRGPLERYNERRSRRSPHVEVTDDLIARVIEQVGKDQIQLGEAGRGKPEPDILGEEEPSRIEAPFLQMVMTRLWKNAMGPAAAGTGEVITIHAQLLKRLGGAKRIVRLHLDRVMDKELDADDSKVAAGLFRYLVSPSGTKIAHTAVDLASYTKLPPDRVEEVLNRLSSSRMRIVRPVPSPTGRAEETRFEVFHDVLAPAVLDWRRRRGEQAKLRREEAKLREAQMAVEAERERAEAAEARIKLQISIIITLIIGTITLIVAMLAIALMNS